MWRGCEYYHIERSFCHAIDVADRVLIVCVKILKYQCCIFSRKEVVVICSSVTNCVFINEISRTVWVQSFVKTISNFFYSPTQIQVSLESRNFTLILKKNSSDTFSKQPWFQGNLNFFTGEWCLTRESWRKCE